MNVAVIGKRCAKQFPSKWEIVIDDHPEPRLPCMVPRQYTGISTSILKDDKINSMMITAV